MVRAAQAALHIQLRSAGNCSLPVGKSGPGTCCISCATVMSGSAIRASNASTTSTRLCGGIRVAMPTAMPAAPLTSSAGTLEGSIVGSFCRAGLAEPGHSTHETLPSTTVYIVAGLVHDLNQPQSKRRQHATKHLRGVKVWQEVDCICAQVCQVIHGAEGLQAALCVAHGCRWIIVNGAKIAMTVHLQEEQRQANQRSAMQLLRMRAVCVVRSEDGFLFTCETGTSNRQLATKQAGCSMWRKVMLLPHTRGTLMEKFWARRTSAS